MNVLWPLPTILFLSVPTLAAEPRPLSGWPAVFRPLPGYAVSYRAPEVGKDRTKEYRQTAQYEWTGGDIRMLTVTLARGAAFKNAPDKAERLEIGKRTGWHLDGVLSIRLGDDRVVQIKAGGSLEKDRDRVLELVKRFDLDRMTKALDGPPRVEKTRSIDAFRVFTKEMTYTDVTEFVGEADADLGSGIHIMTFKLPDGGRVLVGTADFVKLLYIKSESKDGKKEDLLR